MIIALLALALRLCAIPFLPDVSSPYYAEYGEIVKNLHAGNGYSLYHMTDAGIQLWFDPSDRPYPSAYMPPGYVAFLYPFFWIETVPVRNVLIILAQALISLLVLAGAYRVTTIHFGETAGLIAALMVCILPEFIYASVTFSPVVLYQGLVLAFFLWFHHGEQIYFRQAVGSAVLIATATLFRSEFLLFGVAVMTIELCRKRYRKVVMITGFTILLLLPWAVRNTSALGAFVPLTTNGGLNLYRGHNPEQIGAWGDPVVLERLKLLEPGRDLEVRMQELFLRRAFEDIRAQPLEAFLSGFTKLFHLWVFDPGNERSQHPVYLVPWLALLGLFAIGAGSTRSWGRHQLLWLFLISSSLVAFVFFALPRYQTIMKIVIVPFAAYGMVALPALWRRLRGQQ